MKGMHDCESHCVQQVLNNSFESKGREVDDCRAKWAVRAELGLEDEGKLVWAELGEGHARWREQHVQRL